MVNIIRLHTTADGTRQFIVTQEEWLKGTVPEARNLLSTQQCGFGESWETQRGILPLGYFGTIVGPTCIGKTSALLQLALSVTTGRPWLQTYQVNEPGSVLLALRQDSPEHVACRLRHISRFLRLTVEEDRIARERIELVPDRLLSQTRDDPRLVLQKILDYASTTQRDWKLIILDPIDWLMLDVDESDHSVGSDFAKSLTAVSGTPTVLLSHASNQFSDLQRRSRWDASLYPVSCEHRALGLVQFQIEKSNYTIVPPRILLVHDTQNDGLLRVATPAEIDDYEFCDQCNDDAEACAAPEGEE